MIESIVNRHSKLAPLTETEIEIVKAATKLFLEIGFSKTTQRMISKESGVGLGTLTYHFRSKDDLLLLLIEELMDFHSDIIETTLKRVNDPLFAYALEIAVQIALCENDKKAWDLYYSAYSHPTTFEYIKTFASAKNYNILGARLPHLRESDFRRIENITSGIELAAFNFPCDRYFSLEDKISTVLDSMMRMYDVPLEEREQTIGRIKEIDYEKISREMFDSFVHKLKF